MKSYKITTEDLALVEEFVNLSWVNHFARDRSETTVKNNIKIGKIGELAFKKMFPFMTEVNWNGQGYDPGYDFMHGSEKIDVKTLDAVWKNRIYFNSNYMNSTTYAIVRYNPNSGIAVYLGQISHDKVKKVMKIENNATYFDISVIELKDF